MKVKDSLRKLRKENIRFDRTQVELHANNCENLPVYMNDNVLLMYILFFMEISPVSNLICSPNVNFRPVEQKNYFCKDSHFQSTFEHNAFDSEINNTFQSGTLHLIGFKRNFNENNSVKPKFQSIGRNVYATNNTTMKNVLVSLQNIEVDHIRIPDIYQLAHIFNSELNTSFADIAETGLSTFNYNTIFNNFKCLKKNNFSADGFSTLWMNLNMPDITEDCNHLHQRIYLTNQWFSFLSDFRFGCIEGNHRLEFFSRIALGFDIDRSAPLILLENPKEFPLTSTVFKTIPTKFYFLNNNDINESMLKDIKNQSFMIQKQKGLIIKPTWQSLLSAIAAKIMIVTNGGTNEDTTIDPFEVLTTKDDDKKTSLKKLVNIHSNLLDIMIDIFYEMDPAREHFKEIENVFSQADLRNIVSNKMLYWKGITSFIYTQVSIL